MLITRGAKISIFCSLCFLTFLMLGIVMPTSAGETGVRLSLDKHLEDDKLTITPIVAADREMKLRYELTSEKFGQAGRSSTSQSSTFVVRANEAKKLATLSLGVQASDRYTITIRLFEGQILRAEAQVLYPE